MLSPKRTRQVYAWHKWTGLITGLFIFFLSLTGAAVVFKHEIDSVMTPGLTVPVQEKKVPLESLLDTMKKAYPDKRVNSIEVAQWPGHTHQISLRVNDKGRHFFLDPYTGQITGSRSGENLANILRQLHLRFYYFKWQGRLFVGVMGLALLISSLTGLLIYGPFMKKLAFGQIRWKQKLQLVLSDWHKLVGIVTLVFNLAIGLTGAVLGLENLQRFSPAAKKILHPTPTEEDRKPRPATIANRLTIDEAVAKAQEAMPGFSVETVQLPRAKRNHWMLRGRIDGYLAAANTSWIILDTQSGAPIAKGDPRQAAGLTKAYNLSEPIHFGNYAGLPIKLLYCLLGIVSGSLYITGFWVWILKTRRQKSSGQKDASDSTPTAA